MSIATAPRIGFVVDCGGDVGWGHFVRCHALASELRGRGCDVGLFVNGEPPPFADESAAAATGEPSGTVGHLPPPFEDVDAVVLDLWRYSDGVREALPRAALVVTLIDGRDPPFESDLTVDPNVSAGISNGRTRLSGGDYVILRPEFDQTVVRTAARVPDSLVVSFGGTDRSSLLSRVLARATSPGGAPFAQIVAVVPPAPDADGSRGDSMPNVSWRTSVADMPELLLGAEAGLIAAGTLLHEACATGLPCAVVALTPDQELEARALAGRGAVLYLGSAEELTDTVIVSALTSLRDGSVRAQLSTRAREAIDGGGRKRVADALLDRLGRRV